MCWHLTQSKVGGTPPGRGGRQQQSPRASPRGIPGCNSLLPSPCSPQSLAATLGGFSEGPRPHRTGASSSCGYSQPLSPFGASYTSSQVSLTLSTLHASVSANGTPAVYQTEHSAGQTQSQLSLCCSDNPTAWKTPRGQEGTVGAESSFLEGQPCAKMA